MRRRKNNFFDANIRFASFSQIVSQIISLDAFKKSWAQIKLKNFWNQRTVLFLKKKRNSMILDTKEFLSKKMKNSIWCSCAGRKDLLRAFMITQDQNASWSV